MSLACASCGDDDDEPDNGSSIVGTWLLTMEESDGAYYYCQYNFKSNGTLEVVDWSSEGEVPAEYEATGKWSIDGDIIILVVYEDDGSMREEKYKFLLEKDALIIYDYEEPGPNVFVRV